MKIMIVDDNRQIREVIKSVLANRKAEFLECEDAESALAIHASFRPDWILMDIEMSGLDGITATAEIRKSTSRAKIIIVTNYDEPQLRAAALSAGAVAFVGKERLYDLDHIIRADMRLSND